MNNCILSTGRSQTVHYFAHINKDILPGVVKKIEQTVVAFEKMGNDAKFTIVDDRGIKGVMRMFVALLNAKEDVIIIRNTLFTMPFLACAMLYQRIIGTKVIVDIPTPNCVVLDELKMMRGKNYFWKYVRIGIVWLSFPWALFPVNRILQYAHESSYFSLGLKSNTLLVANGVDVDSVPMRDCVPSRPAKQFIMIGVASLASWHGFDRVIRGIADYLSQYPAGDVVPRLIVVGDGGIRSEWESLAQSLGVADCVEFVGYQNGAALDALFDQAHVAIASLGLFRKGLEMASNLKSREYTARGIPFVTAGYDIDFDPDPWFVFNVVNENKVVNIDIVIAWYLGILRYDFFDIRKYACDNLDLSIKLKVILDDII